MHPSITAERIEEMAQESMFGMSDEGICINCGAEAYGVEPDACNYRCDECGENEVFGAQELLMMVF